MLAALERSQLDRANKNAYAAQLVSSKQASAHAWSVVTPSMVLMSRFASTLPAATNTKYTFLNKHSVGMFCTAASALPSQNAASLSSSTMLNLPPVLRAIASPTVIA